MSEFDEIRNRIEREAEKKYLGYRGPRWGAWTPGKPSLLDNPRCTCNGTFDHVTREWHHHVGCPSHGDARGAIKATKVERTGGRCDGYGEPCYETATVCVLDGGTPWWFCERHWAACLAEREEGENDED